MKQMVCSVCTYTYDEAKGIPEAGIAPGTRWEELPDDWKCPWCGAGKEMFREKNEAPSPEPAPVEKPHVERELSPMELSVICSNLARGCDSLDENRFARAHFAAQKHHVALFEGAGVLRGKFDRLFFAVGNHINSIVHFARFCN